jgi:hypothetical protein
MLYAKLEQKIRAIAESINPGGSFFYGNGDAFKSYALNGAKPIIYLADILDTPDMGSGVTNAVLDFAFFGQDAPGSENTAQNTVVNQMLSLSNELLLLLNEDEALGKLNVGERSPFYRLTESTLSGVQVRVRTDVSLSLCS